MPAWLVTLGGAVIVAAFGAAAGATIAHIFHLREKAAAEREQYGVLVYTTNENCRAIEKLQGEVADLGRKISNFEGLLTMRANWQRAGDQ